MSIVTLRSGLVTLTFGTGASSSAMLSSGFRDTTSRGVGSLRVAAKPRGEAARNAFLSNNDEQNHRNTGPRGTRCLWCCGANIQM